MNFTDDEFLLLQAIHRSSILNYPCPNDLVRKASGFIKDGIVSMRGEIDMKGNADLFVTDNGKLKLSANGRTLQD